MAVFTSTNVPVTLRYWKNGTRHETGFYACRPSDEMYQIPFQSVRFHQCVEDICKPRIEKVVSCIVGTLPTLTFIDDEGDRVRLENLDSYVEAMKVAKKMGKLTIVAEERKQTTARGKDSTTSVPEWFEKEMKKMKAELKRELLVEIGHPLSGPPPLAVAPTTSRRSAGRVKPKSGKGDYISRVLSATGGLSSQTRPAEDGKSAIPAIAAFDGRMAILRPRLDGMTAHSAAGLTTAPAPIPNLVNESTAGILDPSCKPKQPNGKRDYISRALACNIEVVGENSDRHKRRERDNEPSSTCGVCGQALGEPYFACLENDCTTLVCRHCEPQHPSAHAMLRLPKQLRGGRRHAVSSAKTVLLSMKTLKRKRKGWDPKPNEEEKKARKMEAACSDKVDHNKWAATCLKTDVLLDQASSALVTWRLSNTGRKQWDDKVKLLCLACSHPQLKPANWAIVVPPLATGEETGVSVKFVTPKQAGEYKTFWALSRRGKRFANMNAVITVPSNPEKVEENTQQQTMNVSSEHSYSMVENPQQQLAPIPETPEEPNKQMAGVPDEEGSQVSGITECKSTTIDEQEYDVIPGNDYANDESMDEWNGDDSSYVSIASPVVFDESSDNTADLTEMWQRLSISLSSITAPNGSDADNETGQPVESDVGAEEAIEHIEPDGELVDEVNLIDNVLIGAVDDELVVEDVVARGNLNHEASSVEETGNEQADELKAEAVPTGHTLDEADTQSSQSSHSYHSDETTKTAFSSRSSSFDAKRQHLSETVSNALSTALLTTTQTLATVGAAAKEIHTIVRSNLHGQQQACQKQWPLRAWVPKATQTGEETESAEAFVEQMQFLADMGFLDVEKNERLLNQFGGNVNHVITALLEE